MNMTNQQPILPKIIKESLSLDEWAHVLSEQEMPVFSNTALIVHDILNDDKKGAMELASIILQDPNLTVKLLKISNSPYYNPSRDKMVTVSRAIIMIGFNVIRDLTLACSFFESILSSFNKEQACEEVAQAIHAAVHAKSIALATRDVSPEEVFIAALLNRIGSISFWCFCDQQGEQIQALVKLQNLSRTDAESHVLGFRLVDLSLCLSKAWKLGELIEESISPSALTKNPRVELVQLGYEIVDALKAGSNSKKYTECIGKIVVLTKQPRQVIEAQFKNNTAIAFDFARQLGASVAAKIIQGSLNDSLVLEESDPVIDKKQLQFQISQDVMSIISNQIDINLLLETVLEGINRTIDMDRTIFSLLMTDKQSLREKLSLGWHKETYGQKILFHISKSPPNLFFHVLSSSQAFWSKPDEHAKLYLLSDVNAIGKHESFLMPIYSNNTPIGLIYADRALSKRPMTEEDFSVFKHFVQQANVGITFYRMQRTTKN